MAINPIFAKLSKNLLTEGILTSLNYQNSNTSPEIYQGIANTMIDYLYISNIYIWQNYLSEESTKLQQILAFNLTFPTASLVARINGLNDFLQAINYNWFNILQNVNFSLLYSGSSALYQTPDIIQIFTGFNSEIPQGTDLATSSQDQVDAWYNAWQYGLTNTNVPQDVTDACSRQYSVSQSLNYFAQQTVVASPNEMDLQTIWNQVVAVHSYLQTGDILAQDWSNAFLQNIITYKYTATLFAILNAGVYESAIQAPTTQTPRDQLRSNENLMQFAARTTGNYENWNIIAQINNLSPPYISTMQFPVPNTAKPGEYLYLPPGPTIIPTSYEGDILGTDIYIGPFNQEMPQWGGDFQTVSGVQNYLYAITRRMLTAVGNYYYDPLYGSRLPAEIGNANTGNAGRMAAYAAGAINQDSRTQTVDNVAVIYTPGVGSYSITADVTPIGTQQSQTVTAAG